jgi:hypothetical protein
MMDSMLEGSVVQALHFNIHLDQTVETPSILLVSTINKS